MATLERIECRETVGSLDSGLEDMETCVGCGTSIADRYLLRIRADSWHEQCAICCVCAGQLQDTCFVKDDKLFCRNDYGRLFGTQCSGCGNPVVTHELVMRTLAQVYHVACFACRACGQQLRKGDQYAFSSAGQLICRADIERQQQREQLLLGGGGALDGGGLDEDDVDSDDCCWEGRGGPGGKRPRTILNPAQRRRFRAAFEANPKPSRKMRESLAAETGLTVRVVQVWFQNQRAKEKKLARRQSHDQKSTDGCDDSADEKDDSNMMGTTGEVTSCDHEPHFSQKSTHNMSDSSDPASSLPGSAERTEDPIDKLYCMQTSYFT